MIKSLFFVILCSLCFNFQGSNKIVSSIDKKGELCFELKAAKKSLDKLIIEEGQYAKDSSVIKNNIYYFKIKKRCGSGCGSEQILFLTFKNNKIVKSYGLDYLSKDSQGFNGSEYEYIYKNYSIQKCDFPNIILKEKVSYEIKKDIKIKLIKLIYDANKLKFIRQ